MVSIHANNYTLHTFDSDTLVSNNQQQRDTTMMQSARDNIARLPSDRAARLQQHTTTHQHIYHQAVLINRSLSQADISYTPESQQLQRLQPVRQ
jgi:hypothetical protein